LNALNKLFAGEQKLNPQLEQGGAGVAQST
jgi:hypothetical protein